MWEYLLAGAVWLAAGMLQGCTGFGSALVAVPLLSQFLPVKNAVVLSSLMGLAINAVLSVQLRANLDPAKIWPLFLGAAPGAVLGALLLRQVNEALVLVLLGAGLVAYCLYGLLARPRFIDPGPLLGAAVGFATGAASAAVSAGGPPTVIYVSLTNWPKDQVKATLSGFFAMTGAMVVAGHALGGLTTPHVQGLALACLPGTLLGVALGVRIYGRMSRASYRRALFVLLGCLGGLLLVQSL